MMYTIDIATGKITYLSSGKYPDWGPGGIVYTSGVILYTYTLKPGESPVPLKNGNDNIWGDYPSWSPDGDRISYLGWVSAGTNALRVIDAAGGIPSEVTTGTISFNSIWTPDGQYIIYTAHDGNDYDIWRVRTGGEGIPVPENLTANNGGADMLLHS